MLLNAGRKADCTELVPAGGQKYREIIYNAHVMICHSTKLKAGILSESELDRHNMTMPQFNPFNEYRSHNPIVLYGLYWLLITAGLYCVGYLFVN